nr:wall-associated receptor kinase-like 14 [Tanacetum cinerariifolium]
MKDKELEDGMGKTSCVSNILDGEVREMSAFVFGRQVLKDKALKGSCDCSNDADCANIVSPDASNGYRCTCQNGFAMIL